MTFNVDKCNLIMIFAFRQSTKVANFITYVDEMCTELYCKLAFEFEVSSITLTLN